VIGTLTGGDAGTNLEVTFNARATSKAVEALIQNLTYSNSSDTPSNSRDLVLTVRDSPSLLLLTGADDPFNGFWVGENSVPSFIDLDSDGDLDLVVGESRGGLRAFDSDGEGGFTALTGISSPFAGIDLDNSSAPTAVDLDGDGDLDLVVGTSAGRLRSFNNDGEGGFTRLRGSDNPFDSIFLFDSGTPSFVDLDSDGDLDLVVGSDFGGLCSYKNNGASGFEPWPGLDPFFDFNFISNIDENSIRSFVDLDGDGDLDLVVGTSDGRLRSFNKDDGASRFLRFTELTGADNPFDGIDVGENSAPSFVDLDGNGDLDLVVGAHNGRLRAYKEQTPAEGISFTISITPENDAPVVTRVTSVTFDEDAVNAAPQLLAPNADFEDAEGNIAGGSLLLTGLLAEDSVSLRDQGTGAGEIGFDGTNVTYSGVVFGTLKGSAAGTHLTIALNAATSDEAVKALLQNLTYANSSDEPTASRDLVLTVSDAEPVIFSEMAGMHNQLAGIDVGLYSTPGFVDLDSDGDLDLVSGNGEGTLLSYRNDEAGGFFALTGTANPFDWIDVDNFGTPAFVDLDGDGDLDLVVGAFDGTLRSYDNDGAGGFAELTDTANPFDGIDVGVRSNASFVDLDGDGDLDFLNAGRATRNVAWYENPSSMPAD